MYPNSIKTKIALSIAAVLVAGMVLINLVLINTNQRAYIQSEIRREKAIPDLITHFLPATTDLRTQIDTANPSEDIRGIIEKNGYSCFMVMDLNAQQILQGGGGCASLPALRYLTRNALKNGENIYLMTGETWGVYWKQKKFLVQASPVYRNGKMIAAIGTAMSLEPYYEIQRNSQRMVFYYVVVNALILTFFGLLRMYQLTLRPVNRLVRRAEEYTETGPFAFAAEKEENEFGLLSKSLNRMLARISDDKEALRTSLASLEKSNLELKHAQNEIIRTEKLASVGRLAAGIAHEIGNPIGIVLGYLGLLKQSGITESEKADYINRAESEITRINRIIRELLDFSRPSTLQKEIIAVQDVIKEVAGMIEVQPFMSGIQLKLQLEAENDRVLMDSNQLRQILVNLLMNAGDAIKALDTPVQGAEILIKSRKEASDDGERNAAFRLLIDVVDNGIGISPDKIGNIFDPFYTSKAPGKGTGLGLSVCFMILDQMGGSIEASNNPNGGTTMRITLPLQD